MKNKETKKSMLDYIDDLETSTYKTYAILGKVLLLTITISAYLFIFTFLWIVLGLALVVFSCCQLHTYLKDWKGKDIRWTNNVLVYCNNWEITLSLWTGYISMLSTRLWHSRYADFLNTARTFLSQYSLFQETVEIRVLLSQMYQVIIYHGYTFELFLMLLHLLSLYLIYKTLWRFKYLFLNRQKLAWMLTKDFRKMDNHSGVPISFRDIDDLLTDEEKEEQRQVQRMLAKYLAPMNMLLIFSTGIPYWIFFIIWFLIRG